MKRADLVQAVAVAAHDAYYCPFSRDHASCDQCCDDGECFELPLPTTEVESDWAAAAEAAVKAVEAATGLKVEG